MKSRLAHYVAKGLLRVTEFWPCVAGATALPGCHLNSIDTMADDGKIRASLNVTLFLLYAKRFDVLSFVVIVLLFISNTCI